MISRSCFELFRGRLSKLCQAAFNFLLRISRRVSVRLDRLWAEDRLAKFILGSVLVLGVLARLVPICINRFHQDEALYSTWALHIATGRDMMLNGFPVDKPPLFLYILALFFKLFGPSEVTARLPGVLASTASVALVYYLARRLYGRPTAMAAAALMALSPFNILLAPTALTDPLLVALVLGALCLAVEGHWTGAGVMAGLAAATKQQGLFFLPLVVGVGIAGTAAEAERGKVTPILTRYYKSFLLLGVDHSPHQKPPDCGPAGAIKFCPRRYQSLNPS